MLLGINENLAINTDHIVSVEHSRLDNYKTSVRMIDGKFFHFTRTIQEFVEFVDEALARQEA